jgi:tetratricopeptide (TPR) repeat protein
MRAHTFLRRAALAVACSLPMLPAAHAQEAATEVAMVNNSRLNASLFYQLLMGEMEFRAGETAVAYQLILDAARKSTDENLFRRASNMALQMRDGPLALAAIQAWRTSIPQSLEAARYEVQVLMALQRIPEALTAVGSMIKLTAAPERSGVIAALPRLFARHKDTKQTAQLAEPVLTPWMAEPATRQAAQVALGRMLIAAGESERALDLVQRAHAQDPSADGPALLALELLATTAQAEPVITGYLQAKPSAASFRVVYARILAAQQRPADAVEQLERVTRDEPDLGAPWLGLGALYLELKQPEKATAVVEEYLERHAGGTLTAEAPAGTATPDIDDDAADPPLPVGPTQAYYLMSRAAALQNDHTAAQAWLDKITDPQQAMDVLLRRANLLVDQGKLQKALELVRKAPDSSPDAPRDKLNIEAQLLTNAKQWAAAEAVLAKANQRFPNDSDLLYQQSMMAEKLNNIADMERLLRRVIELRPDHYHAYNALGYSLAERSMRLPEARELIVKALSLAPGEPMITDSLGWVEYRLGRRDVAIRLLEHAYRLRPDVEIGAHLGEVLWVEGRREEARRILRDARIRDGDNDVLRETIARLKVDL